MENLSRYISPAATSSYSILAVWPTSTKKKHTLIPSVKSGIRLSNVTVVAPEIAERPEISINRARPANLLTRLVQVHTVDGLDTIRF